MNQPSSCLCLEAPGAGLLLLSNLGFDRNYGEAFLLRCPRCSHHWLRYEYALEAISYSGRWYLGLISPAQIATLTADNARGRFRISIGTSSGAAISTDALENAVVLSCFKHTTTQSCRLPSKWLK